ncbi:MAG: alpha/beta hydrolase family protein [Gemmatimonadaceae bacterium]
MNHDSLALKAMRVAIAVSFALVVCGQLVAQQPAPDPKLDPATFDSCLGSYELPSGRIIVIARTERRLYAYEPGSERLRGLERVDDATWVAGPTLLVYTPASYRLTFIKDARGGITALRYAAPGPAALRAKKLRLYREEAVTFRNGAVALSGTLLMPASKGPHPAIVLAHGSSAQDRNGYLANIRFMADHLARHGVAVLTYDKRGSGRSTGDWATASFADLAGDLIAGIRMLRTRRHRSDASWRRRKQSGRMDHGKGGHAAPRYRVRRDRRRRWQRLHRGGTEPIQH